MDKISEAENEDVDEIVKEHEKPEEPENPDYKILERSIKILNEKLETSLDSEEKLKKQCEQAQLEVSELKAKLNETNLNYEKKVGAIRVLQVHLYHILDPKAQN